MLEHQRSKEECSKIIVECLIEVLDETLGKVGREIVLSHLQSKHQIRLGDIVEKPRLFEEKLKELFGSSAELVLRETIQLSSSKIKSDLGGEEMLGFTDYVKKVMAGRDD